MEHITKPDYWQMVKEVAEKHGQQELVELANEHIEAYKIYTERQETKLKTLANL